MSERDLIERRRLSPPPGEDFWVFAYGSLMWNPGFPFLESHPALVRGYHRSFCVESTHYRGTKEKPGLVLGLADLAATAAACRRGRGVRRRSPPRILSATAGRSGRRTDPAGRRHERDQRRLSREHGAAPG
jgi:cation transport regulator ChaC